MQFKIEEIDNGYIIKGEFGWEEDSKGDLLDDFTLYAATRADAFAMVAHKCDQLIDDELGNNKTPQPYTEELPF